MYHNVETKEIFYSLVPRPPVTHAHAHMHAGVSLLSLVLITGQSSVFALLRYQELMGVSEARKDPLEARASNECAKEAASGKTRCGAEVVQRSVPRRAEGEKLGIEIAGCRGNVRVVAVEPGSSNRYACI